MDNSIITGARFESAERDMAGIDPSKIAEMEKNESKTVLGHVASAALWDRISTIIVGANVRRDSSLRRLYDVLSVPGNFDLVPYRFCIEVAIDELTRIIDSETNKATVKILAQKLRVDLCEHGLNIDRAESINLYPHG
jgi:hypothetical protein